MGNLDEALAKAKAEGKLVFACFSGSDGKEIARDSGFKGNAKKYVDILMELRKR